AGQCAVCVGDAAGGAGFWHGDPEYPWLGPVELWRSIGHRRRTVRLVVLPADGRGDAVGCVVPGVGLDLAGMRCAGIAAGADAKGISCSSDDMRHL
ncbi:Multidrug resistance protein D, partial [Pseudomonas sp. FEN]